MKEIPNFFENIFFSECFFGESVIEGGCLIIPVRGVFVMKGHPLLSDSPGPHNGRLIFCGVSESRRTVTEYIGSSREPEGFKPPVDLIDVFESDSRCGQVREYAFEGSQDVPSAWVDNWVVRACSFKFILEEGCD